MQFEILGEISDIETFATNTGIREIARLRRIYGRGRWRKRKGTQSVVPDDRATAIDQEGGIGGVIFDLSWV
jgi:hypothetical protein